MVLTQFWFWGCWGEGSVVKSAYCFIRKLVLEPNTPRWGAHGCLGFQLLLLASVCTLTDTKTQRHRDRHTDTWTKTHTQTHRQRHTHTQRHRNNLILETTTYFSLLIQHKVNRVDKWLSLFCVQFTAPCFLLSLLWFFRLYKWFILYFFLHVWAFHLQVCLCTMCIQYL